MKKLVSVFLTVIMALGVTAGIELSANAASYNGFEYYVDEGKVVIDSYDGDASILSIPDRIGSYPVCTIGTGAFTHNEKLTSVTIPEGVTTIGTEAFCSNTNLASVFIPDSVQNTGEDVFKGCDNLKHIFYAGTRTQWNSLTLNDYTTGAIIHCNHETGVPTGWYDDGSYRYYFRKDGYALVGKQKIGDKYFIFAFADGRMLTGKVRCNGKYYIMSKANGEMLYGMVRCDGKYYIMSKATGEMLYGKVSCNGKGYIMSKSTGEMLYGKVTCNGYTYICSKSDGHIFKNQYVTCNGLRYYCNSAGLATRR